MCVEFPTKISKREFEIRLRSVGDYKVLMDNAYLVIDQRGEYNSETLRDKIAKENVTGDVKIFVTRTSIDAAWFLEPGINDWLTLTI